MSEEIKKNLFRKVTGMITFITEKEIVVQPDEEGEKEIVIEVDNPSEYRVGQRIVHTGYTWYRTPNEFEIEMYKNNGMDCPNFIAEYEYTTEDEKEYLERENKKKDYFDDFDM